MSRRKEYRLNELEKNCLKIWGRTNGCLTPLTVFWTAGGVEFNVKASELWLEIETDYDSYELWGSVLVNGAHVSRQMLQKGRYWLCLFRNMNPDVAKTVRFLRDLQAMSDDQGAKLQIHAVRTDGSFLPVADRPYKLEFIGDSITSGEGTIGAKEELDWISMFFSSVHDYATLVSDACDAECHIISQSGWGVLSSWDNNPNCALPKCYEKVCGVLKGERHQALGANEDYDFTSWQPDAVVINLGTNDGGALDQPQWKDPQTGETFKQHKDENGVMCEEDAKRFSRGVTEFLKKLRKYNPEAQLVWAYGMLGSLMMPYIRQGIYDYQAETKDEKVSFVLLPDTTEETIGARSHPGQKSHERAAKVLSAYLKALLKEKKA